METSLRNFTFLACCIFLGSSVLFIRSTNGAAFPYKKCRGMFTSTVTVWLLNGRCSKNCEVLQNCTTFFGNIIVRSAIAGRNDSSMAKTKNNDVSFPALREITGYLIVVFAEQHPGLPLLFPNLAVIRGMELFLHYALVFYRTELEKVNLPALTVIKSGGVRIDHNEKMCYVETVRWRSIILEKTQTKENFGIVFNKNNKNCYDKCYSGKCFAPSGHGSARLQYCWGPGNKKTGNMECQRFCKATCGPQGCVIGTTNKCCNSECLGGCTKAYSSFHCIACKHYRTGKYGKCVEKCPRGMYVSENFECRDACLYWQYWHFNFGLKYYVHNGHCVAKCPAGYLANKNTRTCDKCLTRRCPRVCSPVSRGFTRTIRIEGLSDAQHYKGCTEIDANISIVIRAGPADTVQKLKEYLGSIETVKGYIEIQESQALGTLGFFENLVQISPKYLYQNEFAVAVFRNMNLKSLWNPKKPLTVSKGQLFFHTNPHLCPKVIKEFQSSVGKNRTDAISETMNGYLAYCNVKKLNITVYEVTDKRLCAMQKCLNVTWYHERYIDSRNLFYSVNYRKVSNKSKAFVQGDDVCGNIKWNTKQVPVPLIKLGNNSKNEVARIKMHALLQNLTAFATYEVFVETYVLNGEGRLSDYIRILLSESISRRPLALEASFLSPSEIQLKWNPPDQPNGIITKYQIYYKKNLYSVWRKNLDWCQRDVTQVDEMGVDTSTKKNDSLISGFCPKNLTCECEKKVQESRKLVQDRDSVLFQKAFEDKIFMSVFSKPRDKEEDNDSKQSTKTDSNGQTTTSAPLCSENSSSSSTCKPTATSKATKAFTKPTSTTTRKLNTTNITTLFNPSKLVTKLPTDENVVVVTGTTFKVVLKNLQYFQEYKIRVCPCNRAGCGTSLNCAVVFGRTDVNTTADNIPEAVRLIVVGDSYNVTWRTPISPNGIILRYDIGIRHNNNREVVRCQLATLPTTLREQGVAAGNYTIRIRAIAPASNGSWTMPISFNIEEKHLTSPVTNTIVIGIGTAAALVILLLVVIVIYYAYVKKTAQMGVPGVLYASVNPEYLNSNEVYIPDEWEVPRDKIELIRELGKGSFGMVYEGIAYGIIEEEPKLKVAVKTVNENASIRDRIEFLQEASIMKAFNCNHIVRLLGVVSQGQPTLVVMELMERGDLKTYLRSRRPEERGGLLPPNLAEILQMAAEIADGMSYLAARKFVHRDLAARNCMVAADFTVKIGDFGMTRDIYETDYYRKGGKGLLPVRWMAPESLKDGIFTTASDVWSYGVVLWEMATLAAQPYPGKSNEDVLRFVIEGGVLEQPDDCSDRLYNMMCNCWKTDPRARPSFLEIVQFLENDVSDGFEEVSYYHEMKRKLLEATETTLLKGSEQVNQVRHGSLKVTPNVLDADVAGSVSSESAAEENWKTEADRGLKDSGAASNARSQSMYDNDGDAVNMRYVEMPSNNGKSKKNVKPVPV